MKSVLLSIQPKWCNKILCGEKTVEIRKNVPKLKPPFKCYIYRSLEKSGDIHHTSGKVIGEFTCDKVVPLFNICTDNWDNLLGDVHEQHKLLVKKACLSEEELKKYAGGRNCYAWHISELVIYDKPKELNEFAKPGKCPYNSQDGCSYKYHCYRAGIAQRCGEFMDRPPQSWCYIEKERL